MCADVWDGFTDDGAGGDQERGGLPSDDYSVERMNGDPREAPERVTELRPAWDWTCDACGRDNYGESLLQKVGDLRSRGRVVSRMANDDDDVTTLPDVVKCSHCGEECAAIPPDGLDDIAGDDCDDVLDDDDDDEDWDDDDDCWNDSDYDEWNDAPR